MEYKEALFEGMSNKDLVKEYDRLFGANMGECLKSMRIGGINWQIDLATGRVKDEIKKFDEFFYYFVWLPLLSINKSE